MSSYTISDQDTFEENWEKFCAHLVGIDPALGEVLVTALTEGASANSAQLRDKTYRLFQAFIEKEIKGE
ncbi:MAG TPA: hypothetical protein VK614_02570 [Allosphingosinicella sp.]|nr:hypothetical protein [Allosphingosinicella sp.]